MTTTSLAQSYVVKATARLKILAVLLQEEAFSDVVRESQEIVELCLKALLRQVGVEPPKFHDVGGLLLESAGRLPDTVRPDLPRLAAVSAWLRKEREFAFYGDVDFIPTEQYARGDADRAIADARFAVEVACRVITVPAR